MASSLGSDARLGVDAVDGGRTALDNKTSLLNTPSARSFSGPRGREFAPYGHGDAICPYDKSAMKEAVFDDDVEQFRDGELMSCAVHVCTYTCCALGILVHCAYTSKHTKYTVYIWDHRGEKTSRVQSVHP